MVTRNWAFDSRNWDPWQDLDRVGRRVRDLMSGWRPLAALTPFPAVNVWADDERIVVTAEVAGVPTEDLHVSVQGDTLTVSGSREAEPLGEGEALRRRERGEGSFARSIALPYAVDPESVQAAYTDGVLRVTLPRNPETKPRKIEITG